MLSKVDIDKLEQRARNAVNGYAADVNITCYVYGQDVLMLLDHIKNLKRELDSSTAEMPDLSRENAG